MKTKVFQKKLSILKQSVANLEGGDMNKVQGGWVPKSIVTCAEPGGITSRELSCFIVC